MNAHAQLVRPVSLAMAVTMTLIACGGGSSSKTTTTQPPASSSSATNTTATTAAPITMDAARAQYLALSDDVNVAIVDYNSTHVGLPASDPRVKAAAATAATAVHTFLTKLYSDEWPPEVRPSIDALVDAAAPAEGALLAISEGSGSYSDLDAAMSNLRGAIVKLRVVLGLPPAG